MGNENIIDLFRFAVTGDNHHISQEFLEGNIREVKHPLYRGLMLPTVAIQEGYLVKEWYGCSHWSSKKSIARRFTSASEVEEYVEEYGFEHGSDGTFEGGLKLFSKVILRLNNAKVALPVGRRLSQKENRAKLEEYLLFNPNETNESLDELIKEDEFAMFGYDFKIRNVKKEKEIYLVDVDAIPA